MDVQDLRDAGLYEKYERGILQAREYARHVADELKKLEAAAKAP